MTKTKWHYTTGQCAVQIIRDGVIKPATAYVPEGERPIVWFSTNQDWELTANKLWKNPGGSLIRLGRVQTGELGGGLVRFGVAPETAPHDWRALKEFSGMPGWMAQRLYRAAIARGARPGEWWGTFEPVIRSQWTAIDVDQDGVWVPVSLDSGPGVITSSHNQQI